MFFFGGHRHPIYGCGGHLFLSYPPLVSISSPLSPLSKCAKHLYICISAFAKREKTLCLSAFQPFFLYTNIQIGFVSKKRNLYICITEVKRRFTNFNARLQPVRLFTEGMAGYRPRYRSMCTPPSTREPLCLPPFRRFPDGLIQKIQKNRPKNRKSEKSNIGAY